MEHYIYDFFGASGNLESTAILAEFMDRLTERLLICPKSNVLISTIDRSGDANLRSDGVTGIVLGHNQHLVIHTLSALEAVFVDYFGDLCQAERAIMTQALVDFFAPSTTNFGDLGMFAARAVALQGAFAQHVCYARAAMDLPTARGLVNDIVAQIKMTPLGASLELVDYPRFDEYDLLQPIAESHIAIHTHGGKSLIDVFSCKPFNTEAVSQLVGCTPVSEAIRGRGIPPQFLCATTK